MRLRVPIAGLMGLVLLVGVGLAALRSGSGLWASLLLTLDLGLLGFATLAVAYRRGLRRAWWAGFAAFGWGYLAVVFGPWTSQVVGARLATTMLLEFLYDRHDLIRSPAAPSSPEPPVAPRRYLEAAINLDRGNSTVSQFAKLAFDYRDRLTAEERRRLFDNRELLDADARATIEAEQRGAILARSGDRDDFLRVGQALWALLAASFGGLAGLYLRATAGPSGLSPFPAADRGG